MAKLFCRAEEDRHGSGCTDLHRVLPGNFFISWNLENDEVKDHNHSHSGINIMYEFSTPSVYKNRDTAYSCFKGTKFKVSNYK